MVVRPAVDEDWPDPGIAVASRLPIVDRRLIELPHGGAALAVRIGSGHGRFWFCCAVPMPGWPGLEGNGRTHSTHRRAGP